MHSPCTKQPRDSSWVEAEIANTLSTMNDVSMIERVKRRTEHSPSFGYDDFIGIFLLLLEIKTERVINLYCTLTLSLWRSESVLIIAFLGFTVQHVSHLSEDGLI